MDTEKKRNGARTKPATAKAARMDGRSGAIPGGGLPAPVPDALPARFGNLPRERNAHAANEKRRGRGLRSLAAWERGISFPWESGG